MFDSIKSLVAVTTLLSSQEPAAGIRTELLQWWSNAAYRERQRAWLKEAELKGAELKGAELENVAVKETEPEEAEVAADK